ncbi:MAG: hypothetical protein CM1200mP15_18890 [Dehalococcoidia bacterium]|nr:MAG: hypothetical protein CM1200mP15_18890 [Dehalococcoidia bacterium]
MKLFNRRIYYGWWVVGAAAGAQFGNAATAINTLTIFVFQCRMSLVGVGQGWPLQLALEQY